MPFPALRQRLTRLTISRRPGSLLTALLLLSLSTGPVLLGNDTWKASPGSGDWNTAGNWMAGTVPNDEGWWSGNVENTVNPVPSADTATLGTSATTTLSFSNYTEINGIVFGAGAGAYTITSSPGWGLTFSGTGITNNSGVVQNFVTPVTGDFSFGTILFTLAATAGTQTAFLNQGSPFEYGFTGHMEFSDTSSAGSGTITNLGGTGLNRFGGYTQFFDTASAGTSTLIASDGTAGGGGGMIIFSQNSTGGAATVQVNGAGFLDISSHNTAVTIGSLAGDGKANLGARTLTVGSNNLDTTFSGIIKDGGQSGGTGGAFTKSGTGTLELTGANTYTGDTTVAAGTLLINNSTGSVLGTGATTVASGATLTGGGSFTGDLMLNGTLSPGNSPGTMGAGSTTFAGGGSYLWEINDATGSAGADPGWDLLSISGVLTISATSGSPFTIDITSLDAFNVPGGASNFDAAATYVFTIATAGEGLVSFSADAFTLNTGNFTNAFTGAWSIIESGSDLNLVYTGSAIPEPSTYAVLFGAFALVLAMVRRRAAQRLIP